MGEKKFKEAKARYKAETRKAAPKRSTGQEADLEKLRTELSQKLRRPVTNDDLDSWLMYPQVFSAFEKHRHDYSDVSVLPTPAFFYGLQPREEISVEIGPGALMGELGFLTPDNRRTGTIECIEDGQVLTITYDRLLEIYFQDPQFCYYFLVLTSQRLLQNIDRLQKQLAAARAPTTNRIA